MADKTVTPDLLRKLSSSFEEDKKNVLAQNSATKNGLIQMMTSHEKLKGRVHVYNTRIPNEGKPVTNQKGSGRCWLYAALNSIRLPVMKKFDLSEFEFSQAFLFFWDKIERTNYMLETFIETREEPLDGRLMAFLLHDPYCDGGQWDMAVNLINKYGLVPKDYYPETSSSESTRKLNELITNKLREYCCKLRSMDDASNDDLRKEKDKMIQEVYNICCISLGTPPTNFSWEYKNKSGDYQCVEDLTPVSFYQTIVKPVYDVDSKVCLINDPRPENQYMKLYTVQHLGNVVGGVPVRYINIPIDQLKAYAIKSLKNGESVWFGCHVGACFHSKNGLNDLDIFDTELSFGTSFLGLDKSQRLKYGESLMTHAMVLTAVHLNKADDVDSSSRWRVENSWGGDANSNGYIMMTDQWFSEFVYEIVVDRSLVPQEIMDVLKQEPIVLPPWDPMGALAN